MDTEAAKTQLSMARRAKNGHLNGHTDTFVLLSAILIPVWVITIFAATLMVSQTFGVTQRISSLAGTSALRNGSLATRRMKVMGLAIEAAQTQRTQGRSV